MNRLSNTDLGSHRIQCLLCLNGYIRTVFIVQCMCYVMSLQTYRHRFFRLGLRQTTRSTYRHVVGCRNLPANGSQGVRLNPCRRRLGGRCFRSQTDHGAQLQTRGTPTTIECSQGNSSNIYRPDWVLHFRWMHVATQMGAMRCAPSFFSPNQSFLQ